MNKCVLLVLMLEAFVWPEIEGKKRLKKVYNYESYSFITIIAIKITKENINYFNVENYDAKDDNYMRDCFGSAIAENWVLTAAYCVQGSPDDKRVILDTKSSRTSSYRRVLKGITHPKYEFVQVSSLFNRDNLQVHVKNDIGLLVIEPLKLKKYGELAPLHFCHLHGRKVSYHRHLNPGAIKSIKTNKDIIMNLRNIEHGIAANCEEEDETLAFKYKWYFELEPALCVVALNTRYQKVQRGASGGPLMNEDNIVSIATGTRPLQFHYTPVSPYINWIHRTMKNQTDSDELPTDL